MRRNHTTIKETRTMPRQGTLLGYVVGIAMLALAFSACPALAAPQLDVQIEHDETVVTDTDERVDYSVAVSNTATADTSPEIGETLTCDNTGVWSGTPTPTLSYRWLRNGGSIDGATGSIYVPSTSSTTTPATSVGDEGKVVQCEVTATNATGTAVQASMPVTVVNPPPAQAPLRCTSDSIQNCRPVFDSPVAVSPGETRECIAPTGAWDGTGLTWTLRWLVNGAVVAETAGTTSTYEFQAADEGTIFQCEATVADDTGAVASVHSIRRSVTEGGIIVTGNAPDFAASGFPRVLFDALTANDTAGPVTLEVELPHSPATYAYKISGTGWSCVNLDPSPTQPARVICDRSDLLKAGGSYPDLVVIAALDEAYTAPESAIATATVGGGGSLENASDSDEIEFVPGPFDLTVFETGVCDETGVGTGVCEGVGDDYTQAGGHPFVGIAEFEFSTKRVLNPPSVAEALIPVENVKQVLTDLPRGLVGNALAVPALCPNAADLGACPPESIVGSVFVDLPTAESNFPLYAIEPEFGTPAQFAFEEVFENVFTLSARLRPEDGYAVSLDLAPSVKIDLLASIATVCGYGGRRNEPAGDFAGCREKGDADANPKPLFTNPTRCEGPPPTVKVKLNSWQNPDRFVEDEWATPAITDCDKVEFEPEIELEPSTSRADSPTGLDVELEMDTDGLETKEGIAQANMKRARIVFPRGMAINASAGHGLGACSASQVKLGTNQPISCPDSSKVGTVEIETPILQRTLEGSVYIAKQGEVGGALIGLYLVFESKRDGIIVKVPGRVDPNPRNGRLVVTVDESPEAPFSAVRMHFPGGEGATLLTPPECGEYSIRAELSPWSAKDPDNPTDDETVTEVSRFEIDEGPGGGPCPEEELTPHLEAGTVNPVAGATSPLTVRLARPDGSQRFEALTLNMPPGLAAYLKGVPYCPDAVLRSISEEPGTGQDEIDDPSCPAASQIGRVIAGAGAGENPFYVDTGRAYLAGPYKGAPLSIAAVTPAVAGPLDLGTVVVRNAVEINPETAQVRVVSDPIPTILHGILLDVRDIRVEIDRPGFTLNPTNCEEMFLGADVRGEKGDVATLANRFQVGNCAALKFKPRLYTRLFGGTGRGAFPKFRAVLMAGPGEANIGRTVVTIPRSEFVEQGHFRTICTRVQFAANACPPGSVYGHVKAFSPLVDYPLEGPVYLRSSDNELPDLVVTVQGPPHQPVKAAVVARIDSIRGQLRATFPSFPDVPVTKAIVTMQGGKKGLLVNSRNVCNRTYRAIVNMKGQNGRISRSRPVLNNGKCKRRPAKRSRAAHR